MKRLKDWTELEVGRIYNSVYVGDNAAYARIDGKETIRVVATKPNLQYEQLYSPHGDALDPELKGGIITSERPDLAFADREFYEPENEAEWFKHSTTCASLGEAIARKLITPNDMKRTAAGKKYCVPRSGESGLIGLHFSFGVRDKTEHQYLQTVYVVWKTWDEMRNDCLRYNIELK